MTKSSFAVIASAIVVVLGIDATPAFAQAAPPAQVQQVRDEVARLRQEFAALTQQYDERLRALDARLSQLGAAPTAATPPADQGGAAPSIDPRALPPSSSRVFNPDTSVIGNFVGAGGRSEFNAEPTMQLTEAEVALQAVVDPYARADFFLAAGPEGLEVEEGFATFTSLPGHLLLKVGKLRAQFGKVNALHTHAMPTVDRPLVTNNLVGGEEGLSDHGISVARLIQNPALFLEATGEVYAGHSSLFDSDRRSRLTYVGRLRGYRDLTEDKNIDLGVSYAFGPIGTFPGDVKQNRRLIGVDATFRYRPLRRALYQRLNVRTELIWSRQDETPTFKTSAFGFYGLGEYQFAQRWYIGGRIDRSGRFFDDSAHDSGASVFLTFWPTEFSQIRTQYRRTNFTEQVSANELLFQLNFSIGAHGAHAF